MRSRKAVAAHGTRCRGTKRAMKRNGWAVCPNDKLCKYGAEPLWPHPCFTKGFRATLLTGECRRLLPSERPATIETMEIRPSPMRLSVAKPTMNRTLRSWCFCSDCWPSARVAGDLTKADIEQRVKNRAVQVGAARASGSAIRTLVIRVDARLARPERIELPTCWFEASRSIRLSYGRLPSVSTSASWGERRDSNPQPLEPQSSALTS